MLRLTVERERRGMTKAQLSREVNIDPATLSRLESGKLYPYPGWKERLSKVFDIPGDALFEPVREETAATR